VKVGLEVHQQLATGKLFCACPSELSELVTGELRRQLRPTGGEDQAIDPAVAFEALRGRSFRYQTTASDCLVEADEEPPHALNPLALEVALTMAELLHARPLDEIEVMRKIVIDGSNTSGFQRTALVAVDGTLELGGRRYSIPTICLEEDAARKIDEDHGSSRYRLDRLGVPLIEIATGPEIEAGAEARAVAQEIGSLLRATRRVRRGIGTIREDLNVSVPDGTRVEIKGVQELRLIERYVAAEGERQEELARVARELARRGAAPPEGPAQNVSGIVGRVREGPLRGAGERGSVALAIRLPGFDGLLRGRSPEGPRLGRELADHARTAGVRGILHSDELPGHGVGSELVDELRSALGAGAEDAFVIVLAPSPAVAEAAVLRVVERARQAFAGVPPETRDPLPDGRTRYSRPLPGRDRMYPETDVPPIAITAERRAAIASHLPELPAETRRRVAERYGLHAEVVLGLDREGALDRFEGLVARGHPAAVVARLLAQDLGEAAQGLPGPVREPTDDELAQVLSALSEGRFAKEGLPSVLRELLVRGGDTEAALRAAGLAPLSRDELERLAEEVLQANAALLADRGERALSPLMGDLMRRVRGRRDGREVAQVLESAVRRHLEGRSATA
jgi:glutamyl-tRNA(Gln) amidotransferase subunit E